MAGFEVGVLLFGQHRERAGGSLVRLTLPDGATVRSVREALEDHPELRGLTAGSAIALNQRYEADDAPVRAGDEIAVIPPVAGG